MHAFLVLDPNGHTRTAWNPDDLQEVDEARRIFEALLKRGYRAFRGGDGESLPRERFDPREEETLLVPPIRGG